MRLLAIRGAQLTSLGAFEVQLDQPPLAESRIFAIVGPTGAGKSTLLDAMCLALYDRVPRLLDAKEAVASGDELGPSDPRTLVRRGAAEAFAEVDFIDRHGGRCRARWDVWRARRRADGRLQNQRVSLTDLDGDRDLTEATKTETLRQIEDRLGLSFEEFRRAVLLAQGDFSAFLRAQADERANLLEKMTGTRLFGALSRAAHISCREAAERLAAIESERASVHVLSPEERAELDTERASRTERRAMLAEQRQQAEALVRWYEELASAEAAAERAHEVADRARKAAMAAAEERAILDRAEAAQALQGPYQSWAQARSAEVEARRVVEVAAANLSEAEQALASTQHQLSEALETANSVKKRHAERAAELGRARDLDGRVAEAQAAVEETKHQVDARGGEATAARSALDEHLDRAEAARGALAATETWLAKKAPVGAIAGQWPAIARALEDGAALVARAAKTEEEDRQVAQRMASAESALAAAAEAQAAAAAARAHAGETLQQSQQALVQLRAEVPSRERRDALETLADLRAGIERLRALMPNARRLDRRLKEEARARRIALKHAKEARRRLEQAREQQRRLRTQLEQATAEVTQAEAVQTVAERRSELLIDGEPCPLCGSLSHPAAHHAPAENPRLASLRARRTRLDNELSQASQTTDAAREAVRTHRMEARDALVRSEEAQSDLQMLMDTWAAGRDALKLVWLRSALLTQRGVHKLYLAIDESPIAKDAKAGLASAIDGLDTARADLADWAEREDALSQSVETRQAQRDEAEAINRTRQEQLSAAEQALTALRHEHQQLVERSATAKAEWQRLRETIASAVSAAVPAKQIATDPSGVRSALAKVVPEYERRTEERRAQADTVSQIAELERGARQRTDHALANLGEARQRHEQASKRHAALKAERETLLDGRSVNAYETERDAALSTADASVEHARRAHTEAEARHAAARTRNEDTRARLGASETNRANADAALRAALATSDFTTEELKLHYDKHGVEWRTSTRARLQAISDRLTAAEAQAQAAKHRLEAHRNTRIASDGRTSDSVGLLNDSVEPRNGGDGLPSDVDLPSSAGASSSAGPSSASADRQNAAAKLGEIREAYDAEITALGRIEERLRSNDEARRQRVSLDARVDTHRRALEEWSELSAVIGSADGRKLRTFAQGLTLESLVAQANLHLQQLRPRYRLERVPHQDMDLMVVDRDLGDEARSLSSLSGGETFLVSLALALALSTLSARDVRIESLFIDEGFGSLDAEALEIALAALDQLQAEGRMIGLISHIPDLAERIGYRVEVVPTGPGSSEVRVHAG